jgi:hypothetical protein
MERCYQFKRYSGLIAIGDLANHISRFCNRIDRLGHSWKFLAISGEARAPLRFRLQIHLRTEAKIVSARYRKTRLDIDGCLREEAIL